MTRDKVNFYQTCITISHHKVHETFLTWLSIKQGAKNATLCDGDKLDLTRHVANPSVKWCELEQHDNHICISVQTEKLCWLAYGLSWMHSNVVKHMSYMHLPCNRFSDHPRMTCPLPTGISSSNRHWVFDILNAPFEHGPELEHFYTYYFFVSRHFDRLALWTTLAPWLWHRRPWICQLGQWQQSLQPERSTVFWQISLWSAINIIGDCTWMLTVSH